MTPSDGTSQSTSTRKTGAQSKQAATWLTPEQIETVRDACLSDTFPAYLQDRNETIITVLAVTNYEYDEEYYHKQDFAIETLADWSYSRRSKNGRDLKP